MTLPIAPIEPKLKSARTLRRMPPLVTAALLFFGSAFGGVRQYIRETNFRSDAVSESGNFLNALDEHRYADASSMVVPEAKATMTAAHLKYLAAAMQNVDGQIEYEFDSGSELTTSNDDRGILLTGRVHARTGWKPLVVSIFETPAGWKVYDCIFNP